MIQNNKLLQRWMWGLVALIAIFFILWQLGRVAILILLSFLVAYVLNPLVTRLAKIKPLARTSATVITLVGLSIGFVAVLFIIIPQVATELKIFIDRLPAQVDKLHEVSGDYVEDTIGIKIPDRTEMYDQVFVQLKKEGRKLVAPVAQITGFIFGTTFSALFAIVGMLMFPLFLFFLLKDFPRIISSIDGLVPLRNKETVHELAKEVDKSLSAFLHGQFTVMMVLGLLYSVGYMIVGIPLALGVGLLTGLLCFVPYIGAASGFVLALLMAIISFSGAGPIIGVIIVFTAVQILDAALITPKILGGSLGLQPLWIIVALMAGGEIFGFLGVLLAVPTTAILKIFVAFSIDHYKHSTLYNAKNE